MSETPQQHEPDRTSGESHPSDASRPDFEQPEFEQPGFEQPGFEQPRFEQPGSSPDSPGYPQQPGSERPDYGSGSYQDYANPGYQPNQAPPDSYPPGGFPAGPLQNGPFQNGPFQSGQFQPGLPGPAVELPPERVGRGIALALVALPVGIVLTAVIFRLGFIASISTFAMAALAPFLYRKASGGRIKKGIPGIVALVVVGVVLCFFAVVSTELVRTYDDFSAGEQADYGTLGQFWAANVLNPAVLGQFVKDGLLFLLFAALGVFGVFRRLARTSRAS